MRHGPAEDHSPTGRDADRALTASGRDRVRSVAKALADAGESPVEILSSPLVRAVQTAEIVAAVAKPEKPVEIRREIAPAGHMLALLDELFAKDRKRVMVVGHEPDLSGLVGDLTGRPMMMGMQKAMVVGVKLSAEEPLAGHAWGSKLRFVLDPKSLAWQHA